LILASEKLLSKFAFKFNLYRYTVVLFSEEVLKINRRGEAVPRVMLVASNAVYMLNAETHRIHRK
jgi:hypothetical protein